MCKAIIVRCCQNDSQVNLEEPPAKFPERYENKHAFNVGAQRKRSHPRGIHRNNK